MLKDINKIRKELEGYDEVELPFDFPLETHIKYITLVDNEESFFTGGKYVKLGMDRIYLSTGGPSWSIPIKIRDDDSNVLYTSRFFAPKQEKIVPKDTVHLQKVIESQQSVIDKMTEIIKKDKQKIQYYENLLNSR